MERPHAAGTVAASARPENSAGTPRTGGGRWRRIGRDYAHVLSGLPISLVAFAVLVPLTLVSVESLVIWIGFILLPVTLTLATGFANLSRRRMSSWGVALEPARYRPAGRGFRGALRIIADPRRWLDLAFEVIVAFPLRLVTFVVALTWTAAGLGGLTNPFWAWSVPGDSGWIQLLNLIVPSAVPQSAAGQYALDSGISCALGIAFLLTLPAILRGLVRLDIAISAALLGAGERAVRRVDAGAGRRPAARGARLAEPTSRAAFNNRAWAWLAATFPALVLVAVGWPVITVLYGANPALAMVVTIGHSTGAVLAVRWAWAGLALASASALGTMVLTAGAAGPWPWPVPTMLTFILVTLVLALRHPWAVAGVAWGVGVLLTMAGLAVTNRLVPGVLANGIVLVSVSAGIALLGIFVRLWARNVSRVARAETVSADEARRRRELQERNRIARELHDVVAHSLSVINVQATTARYRKPGIDPEIQQEFDDIAQSSRQALSEMRALLGILRSDDAAPTAPVPGLADIGDLVEASRASGTPISYSGQEPDVPAPVGLTAFRIVQEGLSNALRHAPGSAIEVTTRVDERAENLVIRVVNVASDSDLGPAPGSGHGLMGIRERVAALGGAVDAGPAEQDGYVISASLPLGDRQKDAAVLPA